MNTTFTLFKLSFIFLISSLSSFAQISQGNMMLGGELSFSSQTTQADDDYENSAFYLSPSYGYFFADNMAIGLNLTIGTETEDNGNSKTKTSVFALGPFFRYYKMIADDKFAFFGEGALLFGSVKNDVTPGGEQKSSSIIFNVSPGFAYFFNNHWAAELKFNGLRIQSYDPDKDNDNDKTTYVNFGVDSFSPSLGVRYHFGGN